MTATPTASPVRRRVGVWAAIGVALVVAGIAAALLTAMGQATRRDALDPASAGPDGTRALVRILARHGVDLTVARDRGALQSALDHAGRSGWAPARATLVLPDSPFLTDRTLRETARQAATVVVPDAGSRAARVLASSRADGIAPSAPLAPGCALPAATRSGPVTAGTLYAVPAAARTTACYRSAGEAALLRRDDDGRTVSILDGTTLFTNERLAHAGNAALAVNLLGAHRTLIWYVPDAAESETAAPTLGDLTPGWASPAIVVLLAAGIAAGVWRGHRFGPLVAESLPVTVRASETAEGRARLYLRSHDRAHAAAVLRADARTALAHTLGLPTATAPEQVADAAADLLRTPRARVRHTLGGPAPATDADLRRLHDELRMLRHAVHQVQHPPTDAPADPPAPPTDSGRTLP